MDQALKINGETLARNTLFNFLGQLLPLLVALFILPFVIRGLGVERFGVFSLIWVVLGYFSLFDVGLGRASTKFIAEALGKGETERIPSIVGTSLFFICVLGLFGGIVFVVMTPFLVGHILKVPHHLIEEAKLTYYVSSGLIPVLLVTSALNGVLEAYQRFDLANMLKVPSNLLSSIIPVMILLFYGSLPLIVLVLLIKNFFMLVLYFVFSLRLSGRKIEFSLKKSKTVQKLFSFGSWMSIVALTSSVITYLDRFLIGSMLSMAAVAYYTPPYEVVSKLWIIPQSLYMTLFPAFSVLWTNRREDVENLCTCASKYLILCLGPIVLILVLFAKDILNFWLGSEFAFKGTWALQILAVGFFMNCQAWIPSTLLQGTGRPDVVAKLFLCELPFYVGVTWWLIEKMGINGAALAWALKGGVEAILFFVVSWKITSLRPSALLRGGVLRGLIGLGATILVVSVFEILFHEILMARLMITIGSIILFIFDAYLHALSEAERIAIRVGVLRIIGIK